MTGRVSHVEQQPEGLRVPPYTRHHARRPDRADLPGRKRRPADRAVEPSGSTTTSRDAACADPAASAAGPSRGSAAGPGPGPGPSPGPGPGPGPGAGPAAACQASDLGRAG